MSEIRNVALLSHSGAGKTSLLEAMLYRSGAKGSLGRIEDGNTASDVTAEEKRRQTSIYSSVVPVSWKGCDFNIIDTPGFADFVGEIRAAQVAADSVVIIVSAAAGVEVGTERVWKSSRDRELSTLLVINKMDRDNVDMDALMAELHSTLPGTIAAMQLPIMDGEHFSGIVNLLDMKAYHWDEGEPRQADIPQALRATAQDYRQRLIEAIIETDDELMALYLDDSDVAEADVMAAFYRAVKSNVLTPVVLTSATQAMGIGLLLDLMLEAVRHPDEHAPLPTEEGDPPVLGREQPFCARVFKTTVDPYLGKVSLIRVLSGVLRSGDTLLDSTQDAELRVAHLYRPNGKDLVEVAELCAGMIGALTKLSEPHTGDTLCDKHHRVRLVPIPLPAPVMAQALYPKTRADEDKLGGALHKLLEEDPTLQLERNAETHETVLWGMGHVHLEVAAEKLRERYHAEVDLRPPRIAYRETITTQGDARYRHKKQSGGAGQFAEVALRVEPLPRGSGFEFVNAVVGGAIPSQFLSSCEKGVQNALRDGVLVGSPIIDVRVTVYDGKDHPVDSKDIAFQIAAAHAFKDALRNAQPVLLEPVALVRVRVPDTFTGEVISDLNTRRGRILGMDIEGTVSIVNAHVPMADVQTYSPELHSRTSGRGAFSIKFDHYAEMPTHLAQRVQDTRKVEAL